jgi:DNA invertase Pin-like site-specific DNA recombinase
MRAKRQPVPTRRRSPLAFSYRRYSDPAQRRGASIRRQTEARDRWLKDHPSVPLDASLRLTDRGKSAFRRRNPDTYALTKFVEEIEAGRVLPGDYLLVENLDRLSREVAGQALELFLKIVNRGVVIVQLEPHVLEFKHPVDAMTLMFAVVELSRGHSESQTKSVRSLANWRHALELARAGQNMRPRRKDGRVTKLITSRLPGWVQDVGGVPQLVEERAAVIRRIFQLARDGYGMTAIIKQLNAEGIPAFGDRVVDEVDEDGRVYFRKAEGQPYGCGEWRTGYVRAILSDRRVLGELQPYNQDGTKRGDAIKDYYPPIISQEEFFAARAAVLGRRNKGPANRQGRIGAGVPNVFSGLLRNARDNTTYQVGLRCDDGVRSRMLRCQAGREGKGPSYTFDYDVFERAVLSRLAELDPAEVLGRQDAPAEVAVLHGELDWVRQRQAELKAELDRGDIALLAEKARQLQAREAELAAQLDDAQQRAAKPLAASWQDAQGVLGLLDRAPEDEREELRLLLRAALRRLLTEVRVLVVPRGAGRRLAAVLLHFEGGARREYVIDHQGSRGNQNGRTPGWWRCVSVPSAHGVFDPDVEGAPGTLIPFGLSDAKEVRLMEAVLGGAAVTWTGEGPGAKTLKLRVSDETLERLFRDAPRHPLP